MLESRTDLRGRFCELTARTNCQHEWATERRASPEPKHVPTVKSSDLLLREKQQDQETVPDTSQQAQERAIPNPENEPSPQN